MNKLRFGICGLGCMGRSHFARLHAHPHACVAAVCDRDAARRAGDWSDLLGNLDLLETDGGQVSLDGIAAHVTTDELIADRTVDAVLIALPTPLHADVAVDALEAGKHVLCEKPMAANGADCERMVRAAESTGRTLMVAQCIRFWPQYVTIKRCVDEGRIGAVRFATLRRLACPPTYSADGWLLDGSQSGGALLDLHLHDVDFAQHLLGSPQAITAHGMHGQSGEIDHVAALFGYRDGRYALLEGGWAHAAPWPFEMGITVNGELGTLEWHSGRDNVLLYAGGDSPIDLPPTGDDAFRGELDYFVDCVRTGRPVERCLPASTAASVELIERERAAIESGLTVPVA